MANVAQKYREAAKAKAMRLCGPEKDIVPTASTWKQAEPMHTERKTGLQPTSKNCGGKVERMARKSGGRVEKAEGGGNWIKGAIKKPGALHKALGVKEGDKIPEKKLEKAEHSKNPLTAKRARLAETLKGMRKGKAGGGSTGPGGKPLTQGRRFNFPGENGSTGPGGKGSEDRVARASGGRAKGKTNISINILAGGKGLPMSPPEAGAALPGAVPVPTPAPSPAAPMPAQIPPMPMTQPQPPMGRKRGGRVYSSYKDMDAGAGTGEGRLEKTEIQKKKRA